MCIGIDCQLSCSYRVFFRLHSLNSPARKPFEHYDFACKARRPVRLGVQTGRGVRDDLFSAHLKHYSFTGGVRHVHHLGRTYRLVRIK